MRAATLSSRDLAATDGAPVNGTTETLEKVPVSIVAGYIVTTTGTPATWDMRAAIEASFDGGTVWHQVLRFKDLTNAVTANQIVRGYGQTAIASADVTASVLGNAAAAAVVVEPPWPIVVRAVTKLQALTGGTAPHVLSAVYLQVA